MGRSALKQLGLWVVLSALVIALLAFGVMRLSDLPGSSRARTIACDDLKLLQRAELRTPARQALRELSRPKKTTNCDSKRQIAQEVAALRQRRQNKSKSTKELTKLATPTTLVQLNLRDRRAATAFQRARIYNRAARLKRSAGIVKGQRTAIRRAIRAYISGLRRDPYHANARKALRVLLARRRGPGSRDPANARCALAKRLRKASLLPEAALVYAQALRTGATSACIDNQLGLSRQAHGRAIARVRDADSRPDTFGGRVAARSKLLEALALDPSLTHARSALAKLPRPRLQDSGCLAQLGDGLTKIGSWLVGAAKAASDHVAGISLAIIALLLALIPLSHALLLLSVGSPKLRKVMDKAWPLHRFTRTRVSMDPADEPALMAVIATVADTYESVPVDPNVPDAGYLSGAARLPDRIVFVESSAGNALGGLATLLDALSAPAGLSAFVAWFRKTLARHEIRVSCQLLPATSEGVGLRVGVRDRRDRATNVFTRRQSANPGAATNTDDAYHELAVDAGEWLRTVT